MVEFPKYVKINDLDLVMAIREGMNPMLEWYDKKHNNLPYFWNYISGPKYGNSHHKSYSCVHSMGRWLDALVNAEAITGEVVPQKQIFADKRVYFVSFLRLIAVPLLALVMIKISHLAMFSADGNKIMLIVFLAIITPSASTITQMCQVYGNDSRYASAINVMTTLFSIITMPLMVMLFEAVI